MIILLTNDDGIGAEGIQALREAVETAHPEAQIYTVAPAGAMSLVGHRVTTHAPIQVEEKGIRSWAVHGTPADCVRLALHELLPKAPDWVFSGINHGGNMGQDIYISGTVAAVREATYHSHRGIAFSQYVRKGQPLDWKLAGRQVAEILPRLVEETLEAGQLLNVNLPHLEGEEVKLEVVETKPEMGPLPVAFSNSEQGYQYTGAYGDRPNAEGSDVHVCFSGRISLSRLNIHN